MMRWLWSWLCALGAWVQGIWRRRRNRRLIERERARRPRRYLLTVMRPYDDCLCLEVEATDRPCLGCRARLKRGYPQHHSTFVVLDEAQFAECRRTASRTELDALDALGLLPKNRREVVRFTREGEKCSDCGGEGRHVHVLLLADAVAHDLDGGRCPGDCRGLHLGQLVWYRDSSGEELLCRYEIIQGGDPVDDALWAIINARSGEPRVGAGKPDPDVCRVCFAELPHHEDADCPGNFENDHKLL